MSRSPVLIYLGPWHLLPDFPPFYFVCLSAIEE